MRTCTLMIQHCCQAVNVFCAKCNAKAATSCLKVGNGNTANVLLIASTKLTLGRGSSHALKGQVNKTGNNFDKVTFFVHQVKKRNNCIVTYVGQWRV